MNIGYTDVAWFGWCLSPLKPLCSQQHKLVAIEILYLYESNEVSSLHYRTMTGQMKSLVKCQISSTVIFWWNIWHTFSPHIDVRGQILNLTALYSFDVLILRDLILFKVSLLEW